MLRLAIPPRHAGTEAKPSPPAPARYRPPGPGSWARYPAGAAFLAALAGGRGARAAWSALPGPDMAGRDRGRRGRDRPAGRGAVVVVPDVKDLARVDAALAARLGAGQHVA